jgi:periplasmic protein TonB
MTKLLVTIATMLALGSGVHTQSGRRKPPLAAPTPSPEATPTQAPRKDDVKAPPVTAEKDEDYRCTSDGSLAHLMDDRAGVKGFQPKEVDTRAEIIARPEPKYTEEARRVGAHGLVVLKVLVSPRAEIDRIRVVRSVPYGLTESAIRAACGIKFKPAMKDGQQVAQWMNVEYGFSLAKSSIFGP